MRMETGHAAWRAPAPSLASALAPTAAACAAPASGTTFAAQSARSLHRHVHRKSILRLGWRLRRRRPRLRVRYVVRVRHRLRRLRTTSTAQPPGATAAAATFALAAATSALAAAAVALAAATVAPAAFALAAAALSLAPATVGATFSAAPPSGSSSAISAATVFSRRQLLDSCLQRRQSDVFLAWKLLTCNLLHHKPRLFDSFIGASYTLSLQQQHYMDYFCEELNELLTRI